MLFLMFQHKEMVLEEIRSFTLNGYYITYTCIKHPMMCHKFVKFHVLIKIYVNNFVTQESNTKLL